MLPLTAEQLDAAAIEASQWRQDLHSIPEILFDLPQTSAFVARKLREFGCDEVAEGIGETGVVGRIVGTQGKGISVGLRSDMDALPIHEQTNLPYSSRTQGHMHACGHDGHMAMLLGAAKALCASRDFAGEVVVIFQPAEEGGAGGRRMIEDGLFERFPVDEIYGMHNLPGMRVGQFASRAGPIMGADDGFHITFHGKGCHAAMPHTGTDPVIAIAALAQSLQTITSRSTNPFDPAVLSVTYLKAGASNAINVVPSTAQLGGTVRTLSKATRDEIEKRLKTMSMTIAKAHNLEAEVVWDPGYPVSVNDKTSFEHAIAAASAVVGESNVDGNVGQTLGSEDFAYMLERRPGAMVWIGNGDTAKLHHPAYDFNNQAIQYGIAYWTTLVAQRCVLPR